MKVLVLDIGGTNLKFRVSDQLRKSKVPTGPDFTPEQMMRELDGKTGGWDYDAVTVGFPAPVVDGRIGNEPKNLGTGWMDFSFAEAFGRPVKLINDAAMQALGCYEGGRMLFLSLGTGLGSAMIVDHHVIPLELCGLRWSKNKTLEDRLGKAALIALGREAWQKGVLASVAMLRDAFVPDSIVIGGGAVKFLDELPADVSLGHNNRALDGGEILWHDDRFRI